MATDSSDSRIKKAVKKIHEHDLDILLSQKIMVSPEKLKLLVKDLGGTYVKLAQFLSYRPDIISKQYRFKINKNVKFYEEDLKLIDYIAEKQEIKGKKIILNEFRKYLELENEDNNIKLSKNALKDLKNGYCNPTSKKGLTVNLTKEEVNSLLKIITLAKERDTERLAENISKHFEIKNKNELYHLITPYTSKVIKPNLSRIMEQTSKQLRKEETILTMEKAYQLSSLMNIETSNNLVKTTYKHQISHFLLSIFSFMLSFILLKWEAHIIFIFLSLLLAVLNLIYSFKH